MVRQDSIPGEIQELQRYARMHRISLFSVFCEINRYATAQSLPALRCKDTDIHAIRNSQRGKLISEILFKPTPPEPAAYVAAAQNVFRSAFFTAVQRMIKDQGTGPGYLQQIMDIPMADAVALHRELIVSGGQFPYKSGGIKWRRHLAASVEVGINQTGAEQAPVTFS